MRKTDKQKPEQPDSHSEQDEEKRSTEAQEQTGTSQLNEQTAQEPAGQQTAAGPAPVRSAGVSPAGAAGTAAVHGAPALTLAEEADSFCADLERFFRRAFGDLPKAADLCELRAEQATVRDMLRRVSEAGGEKGAQLIAITCERDRLKSALAERDAALLQKKADFLNYQARTTKDLTRAEELALRRYMLDLLPVLDSLRLALRDAAAPDVDVKRLKEALTLIATSLNQALTVRGLQQIVVEAGKAFDANVHEAVAVRPADPDKGEKPDTVLEELRAGYLWRDLVLRPAQVLVAAPPKQAGKADQQMEARPEA